MNKQYTKVEPEKPEPYPLGKEGYKQAVGWIRNSGMESWAADEFGQQLHEEVVHDKIDLVVTKVNLMRGCW
jgi:hypothetical protein